jgi:VanZ family protein
VNDESQAVIEKKRIGILAVVAIAAVLSGTLWPFNPWPANEVTWLAAGNGLRFGQSGVVFSEGPLHPAQENPSGKSCTLELLLRPATVGVSDTILAFYVPNNPKQLLIRQWTDGLLVSHESLDANGKTRGIKFDVDHAFQAGKLLLVTMVFGPNATVVYRDGAQAQSFPRFTISPTEVSGQIVMGTSPVDYRPWLGEISGLAIYSRELSAAEVSRHYAQWISADTSAAPDLDGIVARYEFNERAGREVHSAVPSAPALVIPGSFNVPHKAMLTSAVKEFDPGRQYVEDVVENIAGFIPLGAIVCIYFSFTRSRPLAIVYATMIGGVLSFVIEVLQAYIPRRVSGTTDIITNTLGALVGAAIARPDWIRAVLRTAGLLPSAKGAALPPS